MSNKLTWREFVHHARNPIGYGCYEKVFLFNDNGDWFHMCYQCLEENNESSIREYAEQIYNGELEVFLVDSADIEVDETFRDNCDRDLSPYQDTEADDYEVPAINFRDFLPSWAFKMEV